MGGFNKDLVIGLIVSVFFSSLAWVGIPLTIIYFITFPEGSSSIASPYLHDQRIDLSAWTSIIARFYMA